MRPLARTLAALALPLTLVGCGSSDDGEDDVAVDRGPTTSAEPSPTAAPTLGSYPSFGPTDYTYTLSIQCFCADGGAPVLVTVAGDRVVEAVYGAVEGTGRGQVEPGQPAGDRHRLTIDDIIDRANDTEAARVDVDWPAGQDHPDRVHVDGDAGVADDEVGYVITDVRVA